MAGQEDQIIQISDQSDDDEDIIFVGEESRKFTTILEIVEEVSGDQCLPDNGGDGASNNISVIKNNKLIAPPSISNREKNRTETGDKVKPSKDIMLSTTDKSLPIKWCMFRLTDEFTDEIENLHFSEGRSNASVTSSFSSFGKVFVVEENYPTVDLTEDDITSLQENISELALGEATPEANSEIMVSQELQQIVNIPLDLCNPTFEQDIPQLVCSTSIHKNDSASKGNNWNQRGKTRANNEIRTRSSRNKRKRIETDLPEGQSPSRKKSKTKRKTLVALDLSPSNIEDIKDRTKSPEEKEPIEKEKEETPKKRGKKKLRVCKPLSERRVIHDLNGVPWKQNEEEFLEINYEGVREMMDRDLADIVDINEGERKFMIMWNKFRRAHLWATGFKNLEALCHLFIKDHGEEVIEKKVYRNFIIFLNTLSIDELISQTCSFTLIHEMQQCVSQYFIRKNAATQEHILSEDLTTLSEEKPKICSLPTISSEQTSMFIAQRTTSTDTKPRLVASILTPPSKEKPLLLVSQRNHSSEEEPLISPQTSSSEVNPLISPQTSSSDVKPLISPQTSSSRQKQFLLSPLITNHVLAEHVIKIEAEDNDALSDISSQQNIQKTFHGQEEFVKFLNNNNNRKLTKPKKEFQMISAAFFLSGVENLPS